MKVLLDSLHLNAHTQELYLYPNKLQSHLCKFTLDGSAKWEHNFKGFPGTKDLKSGISEVTVVPLVLKCLFGKKR